MSAACRTGLTVSTTSFRPRFLEPLRGLALRLLHGERDEAFAEVLERPVVVDLRPDALQILGPDVVSPALLPERVAQLGVPARVPSARAPLRRQVSGAHVAEPQYGFLDRVDLRGETFSARTVAEVEERVFREAMDRGLADLAARLQEMADATPCEGSDGRRLRRTRRIGMEVDTTLGKARVTAVCGQCKSTGGWETPFRDRLFRGERGAVSPAPERRIVTTVCETGSFEKAAKVCGAWGCELSDDEEDLFFEHEDLSVDEDLSSAVVNGKPDFPPSAVVYVKPDSTGWDVEIPGTWMGCRIEYVSAD